MTTDLYRNVLATDGFVADPNDFNNAQSQLAARLFDQVLGKAIPNMADIANLEFPDVNGADVAGGVLAFCLHGGAGRPKQGSANNKVKISAGTLFQKIGAADGAAPALLAYTFPGTDEVSIANGDGTHPRVDIVQMKLEYIDDTPTSRDFEDATTRAKSTQTEQLAHRVKCTLSVKQGTPAVSPTYPSPDAGCVMIAGVLVETAYAAAAGFDIVDTGGGPVAVLHDQRMPIRMRTITVLPAQFTYDPAVWGTDTKMQRVRATVTPDDMWIICPIGGRCSRLVGVSANTKNVVADVFIAWYEHSNGGTTVTQLNNAAFGTSASMERRITRDSAWIHNPAVGTILTTSPDGITAPVWTSGCRAPLIAGTFSPPEAFNAVCLLFRDAADLSDVGPVTFYVADGL